MLIPTVKWAQRPNVVYLTIDVQDTKDPQIELSNTEDDKNGHLTFKAQASGESEDALYQLDLVLFSAVDKDKSKINITPRSIFLVLEKTEPESWPRLTKESGKHLTHIKVDWDKWVDSDDEEDNFDPSSMDMSSMAGLGGGGGMGGLANMMGGGMRMPGMGMMPGMMGGGGAGMPGAADLQQMLAGLGAGGAGLGAMGGGLGNMNFEDMGAGGIGDTAGVDDDSDDEDLPELEA